MTTAVKYIGRKPSYTDFAHGSKLTFAPGQTRQLPNDLARKLLRQVDIFEAGGAEEVVPVVPEQAPEQTDDTAAVLLEAQKQQAVIEQQDRERNDLIDQVRVMERSQLEILAKDRWNQVLHHKTSLENARAKVIQFVNQYGPS